MIFPRSGFPLAVAITLTAAFTVMFAVNSSATAAESTTGAVAMGSKAPAASVKMKNVDGKLVSISDVTGKAGTLVVFTCNHCPFAKAWEERIVDLSNGYAKKGVGVILINANDPATHQEDDFAEMQARAKSRHLQVPYVVDDTSGVARAFGATVTPEAFLFDKGGKLVYHGAVDDNHKQPDKVQKRYLKDALDAVVAGKPPATPESKGIGCGIKFRKA